MQANSDCLIANVSCRPSDLAGWKAGCW